MVKIKKDVRQAAKKTANRGAQTAKQRNKHKVTLEQKGKSKLRSVVRGNNDAGGDSAHGPAKISFQATPPPGYTFIPAGNPELTAALKAFAHRGDHKIFAVTTTPHAARHELSREVHRIGFHFPTHVVAQVCAHYGIRLTRGGKVIDESRDEQYFQTVYQNGKRPKNEPKDQVTINTDAKQIIKDLFPNIPDNDLFQIIKTAFQLGENKVGTADEIPLARRAQLSVVAHIRHGYTQYDKLLRVMPYNDARHQIEQDTLNKLIEWRGDDTNVNDTSQRAADDLLREVIVISDEEDSDADGDSDGVEVLGQENVRIEELPSTAYGHISSRPSSPTRALRPGEPRYDIRELPRVLHHERLTDHAIAQRDRSRYAVWDQARRDYHSRVAQQPVAVVERIYEPVAPPASRILVPLDSPSYRSEPVLLSESRQQHHQTLLDHEDRRIRPASPRTYIRGADGTLYERLVTRPVDVLEERPMPYHDRVTSAMPSGSARRNRPPSPHALLYREYRSGANDETGDGTVLPSIEGPDNSADFSRSYREPTRPSGLGREDIEYRYHLQARAGPSVTGASDHGKPWLRARPVQTARVEAQSHPMSHTSIQDHRDVPIGQPSRQLPAERTFERLEVFDGASAPGRFLPASRLVSSSSVHQLSSPRQQWAGDAGISDRLDHDNLAGPDWQDGRFTRERQGQLPEPRMELRGWDSRIRRPQIAMPVEESPSRRVVEHRYQSSGVPRQYPR